LSWAEHIQRKFRVIGDEEVFVAEDATGELGLYATDKNQLLAAVTGQGIYPD
jgi:hypothetical protein